MQGKKFTDNSRDFGPEKTESHHPTNQIGPMETGEECSVEIVNEYISQTEQMETDQECGHSTPREHDDASKQDTGTKGQKLSQKQRYQKQIAELKDENQRYQKQIAELKDENQRLQKELDETKTLLKQGGNDSSVTTTVDTLSCEVNNLKKETHDLEESNLNEQKEKLQRDVAERDRDVETLKAFLEEKDNAKRNLNENLQREIADRNTEIQNLKTSLQQKDNAQRNLIENWQREIADRNTEIENLKTSLQQKDNALRNEIEEAQTRIASLNNEVTRLYNFEEAHYSMQEEMNRMAQAEKNIQRTIQNIYEEKNSLIEDMNKLKAEKHSLLIRLSKVAGDNMTFNNPNIADLSDSKRPTKLAEEFSELYDNEWTDAFECIFSSIESEKDSTAHMLALLMRSFEICKDVSTLQDAAIKHSLTSLTIRTKLPANCEAKPEEQNMDNDSEPTQAHECTETNELEYGKDVTNNFSEPDLGTKQREEITVQMDFSQLKLNGEHQKAISDIRKHAELTMTQEFEKNAIVVIVKEYGVDPNRQSSVVKYIAKCVNICWSMCRNEPPVHIEVPVMHGNASFDSGSFKPYTKTGKVTDFIVWPPMYLHKDGPMLSKGVAQAK